MFSCFAKTVIFRFFLCFAILMQVLYGTPHDDHVTENTETFDQSATTTSQEPDAISELCRSGVFDAITQYEFDDGITSTIIFKEDYYFILTSTDILDGFSRKIKDEWPDLPKNIDAALYWKEKTTESIAWDCVTRSFKIEIKTQPACTFFFKGSLYWKYENHRLMPSYPKNISDGWHGIPDNIDAAFVWSGNGKTYFIKSK